MKNKNKIVLWGVTVLDGKRDMEPQKNRAVYICNGIIEKITGADHPDKGYDVMDLTGQYLLPGLINLHVHLPASGKPRKKASDPKKLVKLITANRLTRKLGLKICEKYARMELMSGVTTLRTVGGASDFDTLLRDRIASGRACGPRILASDMAISVPGGHMAGSLAWEATSAQDAASLVDRIAAGKPDLIKLMITGGVLDAEVVGEPGVLRMPPEYVKSACDRAHALGLKVAAHVESPEGVKVALENGVDSIEQVQRRMTRCYGYSRKKAPSRFRRSLPLCRMHFLIALFRMQRKSNRSMEKLCLMGLLHSPKPALRWESPWGLVRIRGAHILRIMICGESFAISLSIAA